MVNFKKLAEKMELERERKSKITKEEIAKEEQDEYDRLYPYHKRLNKLKEYTDVLMKAQYGFDGEPSMPMPTDWEIKFIYSTHSKYVGYYIGLSDKEKAKVDELFGVYCSASPDPQKGPKE